jgi:hypothetical protein
MGAFLALIRCHVVSPFIASGCRIGCLLGEERRHCRPLHFLLSGERIRKNGRLENLRGFLEFAHLQYRSSLFDEGRDVILGKDS